MPAVLPPSTVLVTGASGFLGAQVAKAFVERGYSVRGTVRSPSKGDYLRALFKDLPGKFDYVIVADIGAPGAFDKAVEGVDAIAHTASPVELAGPDESPEKLIKPAVSGTVGILESAAKYGNKVRRIVMTSSVAALLQPHEGPYEYSEDDWNDFSVEEAEAKGAATPPMLKYRASKTLAERALWKFLEDNKATIQFDAVTVLPPFIYGPIIQEISSITQLNLSTKQLWDQFVQPPTTDERLRALLGNHIDVRDVAAVHVDAIEKPELAGRRLVIGCGPLTPQDLFDAANNLPAGSLRELPFPIPVGKPGIADGAHSSFVRLSTRSQQLLGREFIKLPEIVRDTLNSIKDRSLV